VDKAIERPHIEAIGEYFAYQALGAAALIGGGIAC